MLSEKRHLLVDAWINYSECAVLQQLERGSTVLFGSIRPFYPEQEGARIRRKKTSTLCSGYRIANYIIGLIWANALGVSAYFPRLQVALDYICLKIAPICPHKTVHDNKKDQNLRSGLMFIWSRGLDLNQRPSGYEPDELPSCSTPHYVGAP